MKTVGSLPPTTGDFIPVGSGEPISYDAQNAKIVRRKRLELRKLMSGNGSAVNHLSKPRQQYPDDDAALPATPSPSTSSSENLAKPMAKKARPACLSCGATLVMGRRREMEDAARIERGFAEMNSEKLDFFGVFDGHGGEMVANACRDRMHRILGREIEALVVEQAEGKKAVGMEGDRVGGVNWEKVMLRSFEKMDREVGGGSEPKEEGEEMTVGSTAVMAVVGKDEVVVANCGDSRAVLCRNGVAMPLSVDHKPDRPDELARIEAAGGRVINWNGPRVLGVLATSRSIGDNYLKPYVIAEPEVTVCNRTRGDEFLILASDGLWDVVSNELACQFVRKCLYSKLAVESNETGRNGISAARTRASEAAAFLANLALTKGSRDNISVVVVELKKIRRSSCS